MKLDDDQGDRFNAEIKARCSRLDVAREILLTNGALPHGTDRQTDTYFVVPRGCLKVREGTIENALIAYDRPVNPGVRPAAVVLTPLSPAEAAGVREVLEAALPVRARILKTREILFAGNVKFHLDRVDGLGTFLEIEAQSRAGRPAREALEAQAEEWRARLGLDARDLLGPSYSELTGA